MRLRRVHLEGLQSPRGGHALLFRPGYNVVLSAEPAQRRGIRRLLEGLLYPGRLGKLSDWCLPAGADPARAALEFEAAGEAYRIVVDFAAERVGLGRSGAEARGYRLHAEGPGEVDACLDSLGRPPLQVFRVVCSEGASVPEGVARSASSPDGPAATERVWLERRQSELTRARAEVEGLRAQQVELEASLEAHSSLSSLAGDEEFAASLEHFRELSAGRGEERSSLAAKQQELRQEREQLRLRRSRSLRWMLAALAGCLAAAVGASLVGVGWLPIAFLGLGFSGGVWLRLRSLRRQRARIEARGGALWVREQVLGGSGGFETGVVLRQLDEFGFRSVEDLEGALEEVEALKSRHAAVSRELGKVRERFSESAEEELHDLEQRLAESSESVGFAEAVQEGADLGESLREVAGWLGRGEAELAGLVLSDLEPYLMDLSSGQLTRPSVGAGGWSVCVDQDPNPCLLAHASAGTRARFELALRFALVEQMLERGHFPMLIGPEFPAELGSEFWPEVAQALSRLAAGVQVVQTAPLGGPWGDLASAIHPV